MRSVGASGGVVGIGPAVKLHAMTMTVGTGPFGHRPAGRFNFELPERVEYLEAFPRRIRALVGGEIVADSVNVRMLHEQHRLPAWCFPPEDVRRDALGDAAWLYEEGLAKGLVGIRWDAVDQWLEEEEKVIAHPRDPYHRLELRNTSRRVEVTLDGETVALSSKPLALFETALPPRWYFEPEEVTVELDPNPDVRTACAYKGWASYFDARIAGRVKPALAWHYDKPLEGMERIRGRVCFFNERVELTVDGIRQEQPRTRWSTTDWITDTSADERGRKPLALETPTEA
jgi:uncharacterized protein (DUF427 family)